VLTGVGCEKFTVDGGRGAGRSVLRNVEPSKHASLSVEGRPLGRQSVRSGVHHMIVWR
jgi:hypothetical protein